MVAAGGRMLGTPERARDGGIVAPTGSHTISHQGVRVRSDSSPYRAQCVVIQNMTCEHGTFLMHTRISKPCNEHGKNSQLAAPSVQPIVIVFFSLLTPPVACLLHHWTGLLSPPRSGGRFHSSGSSRTFTLFVSSYSADSDHPAGW